VVAACRNGDELSWSFPASPRLRERIEVRGNRGGFLVGSFRALIWCFNRGCKDGIDKALGSSLIQRRNLNEPSCVISLSDLQKNEVA